MESPNVKVGLVQLCPGLGSRWPMAWWVVLLLAVVTTEAFAQTPTLPQDLGETTHEQTTEGDGSQVQFLSLFFTRAEVGNVAPENDLFRGQTVGRLFGPNTTRSSEDERSYFVEQRLLPFIIVTPDVLNGD
ncbi:MAG: hypothetical protein AAFX99_00165, partial [Myxococcota bacterium]